MKPTIEEIKQKYANAKEVKCNEYKGYGKIFEIDINSIRYIRQYSSQVICNSVNNDTAYVSLFHNNTYAEIISYKEETLPIKKTTLLQLAENNSFSESIIKKEFPKLFESELEVNRWYKNPHRKSLMYFTKTVHNTCFGYGFDNVGIWNNELEFFTTNWIPVTEQEVFEALKNEAVKKGFKVGCKVIAPKGTNGIITDNFSHEFRVEPNKFYFHNMCVFENGQWAEIIDQPKEITISERLERIEKHLGI